MADHFWPRLAQTMICLSIPHIGVYLGFISVVRSLYEELFKDGHWRDLFNAGDTAQDGRCDLFYKLAGCGVAWLTRLWV